MTNPEGIPAISPETRQRIEESLDNWDSADCDARKRFEAAQEKWDQALKPLEDAIIASERQTEADFSIRINTRVTERRSIHWQHLLFTWSGERKGNL